MSHADICPCHHGVRICEGDCRDCLVDFYGEQIADLIIERDKDYFPVTAWGPHPPCPTCDDKVLYTRYSTQGRTAVKWRTCPTCGFGPHSITKMLSR